MNRPLGLLHVQPAAALLVLGACTPTQPPRPPPAVDVPVTAIAPQPVSPPRPASDRPIPTDVSRETPAATRNWQEAYPSTPLAPDRVNALRAIARDARHADGPAAAFTLGRRVPRTQLEATLGEIAEAQLEHFARGLMGRALNDGPGTLGRFAALLDRPTPSSVIASLVQRFKLPLGGLHGLPLRNLTSSSLDEQLIGAALAAAPDADSISPTIIAGLHPVALSTLSRSMRSRAPDVRHGFEAQAISLLGERMPLHPRSWANAVRTLIESSNLEEPSVRMAFGDQVPRWEAARLEPPSVAAAFRCALSVVADRHLGGDRVMRCAEGSERWRSLAARAERITTETNPREPVARIQAILREAGGEPRVLEALARAVTHAPTNLDATVLQSLARSNEPGVLAELLEGISRQLERGARAPAPRKALLDRWLTPTLRQRLLRAPFELPEESTIEARTHAIALLRLIGEPMPAPAGTARAIQAVLHPDDTITPDSVPEAAPRTVARLSVQTTAGRLVLSLRGDTAPEAVRTVLGAARAGRYRGTTIHRVVPWFVAQGGDPRGDGYGGTDRIVRTEVSGESFDRGAVGIPLGGLDSGGMQLFAMLAPASNLDARYPWVGTVTEGLTTLDRLMVGDVIEEVTVLGP